MPFFRKIRRHAAVARGDFGAMFGDVEIPPLPAALSRLVAEVNSAEPDIERLAKLISSSPGLAAKVIKTVNSAFYGLRVPVDNVKRAVTLMGLEQVRSLSLAFATLDALPIPTTEYFNHDIFWTDSLFRATMARSLARKGFADQLEQVFTVSLLADLAIPVLLDSWSDYYLPVFAERMSSGRRLADIEREHFNWDHAQAGAWILQGWGFPDELVCCLACHTLNREELMEEGLDDSPAMPVAVASLLPSVGKAEQENLKPFFLAVRTWLGFEKQELVEVLEEVGVAMSDVFNLFALSDQAATDCLDLMSDVALGWPESEDA